MSGARSRGRPALHHRGLPPARTSHQAAPGQGAVPRPASLMPAACRTARRHLCEEHLCLGGLRARAVDSACKEKHRCLVSAGDDRLRCDARPRDVRHKGLQRGSDRGQGTGHGGASPCHDLASLSACVPCVWLSNWRSCSGFPQFFLLLTSRCIPSFSQLWNTADRTFAGAPLTVQDAPRYRHRGLMQDTASGTGLR